MQQVVSCGHALTDLKSPCERTSTVILFPGVRHSQLLTVKQLVTSLSTRQLRDAKWLVRQSILHVHSFLKLTTSCRNKRIEIDHQVVGLLVVSCFTVDKNLGCSQALGASGVHYRRDCILI